MYEEISIKRKIDWRSLLIKCGLLLIVVFIICAIAFSPRKTYAVTPLNGINNKLLKAGKNYYKEDLLPTKFSESKQISLMELVEKELIKSKEYNSNNCDFNESYVKVLKVNAKEFSISSHLICGNEEDTVVDTITIKEDNSSKETPVNKNSEENFEIKVIE